MASAPSTITVGVEVVVTNWADLGRALARLTDDQQAEFFGGFADQLMQLHPAQAEDQLAYIVEAVRKGDPETAANVATLYNWLQEVVARA